MARNDQRDLILLRNQVAHYAMHNLGAITPLVEPTAPPPATIAAGTDAGAAAAATVRLFGKKVRSTFAAAPLPEPISHHSACATCPYNTVCCALLGRDASVQLHDGHPLRRIAPTVGAHLSAAHIDYFVHWSGLLALEESQSKGGMCDRYANRRRHDS